MTRTDLLLLFPGVTEARHFPYLSLPQLTAFCRERGYRVAQRDLNIELSRRMLQPDVLARKIEPGTLTGVRSAVLEYLFGEAADGVPAEVRSRIELNCIDTVLAGSVLVRRAAHLDELIELSAAVAGFDDIAAAVHDALVRAALLDARPRVVGLSVAFFSQLVPALRVARIVREVLPDALVVLGGQQVMMRKSDLAAVPGLDAVVDRLIDSAGEAVLPALLDEQRRTDRAGAVEVPAASGWRFRDNPPPVFDGLPFQDYFADRPQLPVLSCIGCYWGRCTFCSYGNRSLREGYQQLDHRTIANTVCGGVAATGARRVTFVDENSNLNVLLRAMELVQERGCEVTWSTRNRVEPALTDPALCRRLAASGCVLMSVGYETTSQRLLDELNKGVSAATYQTIVDNLEDAGVALRLSVLGGVPGETAADARESMQFLVRNSAKVGIDVAQMVIVEPDTLLAKERPPTSSALVDNTGFSYLGGRVGGAVDHGAGPSREERAGWLGELVAAVLPGKNDDRHPRYRAAGPVSPVWRLRLNPWIVAGADGDRLHDVRWLLTYRLGRGLVRHGRDLEAGDPVSASRLGLLAAADVGVVIPSLVEPGVAT